MDTLGSGDMKISVLSYRPSTKEVLAGKGKVYCLEDDHLMGPLPEEFKFKVKEREAEEGLPKAKFIEETECKTEENK